MSRITLSTLSLVLGLVFVVPAAWAAVDRDQAVSIAQHVVPGRVLSVERALHIDNTVVWRVKVLTAQGEMRDIVIDAQTGRTR